MQTASLTYPRTVGILGWHSKAALGWKIAAMLAMAGLTGLLAQIRLPLAFTPVPVTGQTLAVLLAGVLLGKRWGSAGMAVYVVAGIAGIPWFNGAASGFGSTGGYLIGFILAAYFVGYLTEKYAGKLNIGNLLAIMLGASVIIYLPGIIWLSAWLNIVAGQQASLWQAFNLGAVPFIAGDILKAVGASSLAWVTLPKTLRH